jgi:predicted RNase H-like nuclease (RuvC/YqgF family)
MFETAGVARTERSIINWCQPNRQGIARLDSYFDPNERKYYITPQSVELAIQEELQRAKKSTDPTAAEAFGSVVETVKHSQNTTTAKSGDDRKIQELEREIRDLKITNRAKDMFIEQLKDERSGFFEKLLSANRTMCQLETKLNQLNTPKV